MGWSGRCGALALLASACGGSGGGGDHGHLRRRGRRHHLLRHDREPDGLQPEHAVGRHARAPGRVLGAVLPSPFVVNSPGAPTANSNLIVQSELVSTKPETIVYTLNPKAVWSDGVPITAGGLQVRLGAAAGRPAGAVTRRRRASPATATSRR